MSNPTDQPVLREIERIRRDVTQWIASPAALDPLSYQLCVDAAALVEEFSRLRGEVARLQSERDAEPYDDLTTMDRSELVIRIRGHRSAQRGLHDTIRELRAEVTAAKADALDEFADNVERYSVDGCALWAADRARRRAADTRAELGDS